MVVLYRGYTNNGSEAEELIKKHFPQATIIENAGEDHEEPRLRVDGREYGGLRLICIFLERRGLEDFGILRANRRQ